MTWPKSGSRPKIVTYKHKNVNIAVMVTNVDLASMQTSLKDV